MALAIIATHIMFKLQIKTKLAFSLQCRILL